MIDSLPRYKNLQKVFKGDFILPTDEGYKLSLKRWAATAQKQAGLVVFVKDEEDIQAVLKFANDERIEIAVKCGGHSVSGASSTEGGIVIGLSRYFNTVKVDEESKIGHIGGGANWRDVDLATAPYGLASVAGTISHTGVGGLILGDGYGYLTGEFGLAIDNLVSARVVSSNGEIHNCSENENPDLIWAIRGGGGNFAFEKWLKVRVQKNCILLFFQDMGNGPVIMAHCFHNGPLEDGKEQFKLFYDLGPIIDDTKTIPYLSLNISIDDERPYGTGLYWHGSLFPPNLQENPKAGINLWNSYMTIFNNEKADENDDDDDKDEGMKIFRKSSFIVFDIHQPTKYMEKTNEEMAFNGRNENINILIGLGWDGILGTKPSDKARYLAKKIARSTLKSGEDQVPEEGYPNWESDTPTGFERSIKLFGDKYPKLQEIKAKYDPNNIFNKWYPIEPKAEVK